MMIFTTGKGGGKCPVLHFFLEEFICFKFWFHIYPHLSQLLLHQFCIYMFLFKVSFSPMKVQFTVGKKATTIKVRHFNDFKALHCHVLVF